MTFKDWEAELERYLDKLPYAERRTAIEYYREIYCDKTDAGYESNKILMEFGFPKDCADKIIADFAQKKNTENPPAVVEKREKKATNPPKKKNGKNAGRIVGFSFAAAGLSSLSALMQSIWANCATFVLTSALGLINCSSVPAALTVISTALLSVGLSSLAIAALFGLCKILINVLLKLSSKAPFAKEDKQ